MISDHSLLEESFRLPVVETHNFSASAVRQRAGNWYPKSESNRRALKGGGF